MKQMQAHLISMNEQRAKAAEEEEKAEIEEQKK